MRMCACVVSDCKCVTERCAQAARRRGRASYVVILISLRVSVASLFIIIIMARYCSRNCIIATHSRATHTVTRLPGHSAATHDEALFRL